MTVSSSSQNVQFSHRFDTCFTTAHFNSNNLYREFSLRKNMGVFISHIDSSC